METPLSLLKTATSFSNLDNRTEIAIKACKKITDVLPFSQKCQTLLEEPELMKYLLLSLPLNPRSIEWLVSSMIDKFKYDERFIKALWTGFVAIAYLNEKENDTKKSINGLKMFQMGVKKALHLMSKKNDDVLLGSSFWVNQNFCDEINENKEAIKVSCLKQIKKFGEIYSKELKDLIDFKPEVMGLLKKFIVLTSNANVIMNAMDVVEKMKKEGIYGYDPEIDEILIEKRPILMANEAPKEIQVTQRKPLSRAATFELTNESKTSITRIDTALEQNGSLTLEKKPSLNLKKWTSVLKDVMDPKFKEMDSEIKEKTALNRIEEWLAETQIEQIPLISNKENVGEYLMDVHHFEVFLSFIFEPESHPLGTFWEAKHPSLAQIEEESKLSRLSRSSLNSTPQGNTSKISFPKQPNLYVLRSFKAMQALCDERNSAVIFEKKKETLETYFHHAYEAWSTKVDPLTNYNHIGQLTETLVRKDPEICIGFILHYNLLYKYFQHIESPFMQKLLFTLFRSSENAKDIHNEAYRKLLRYCASSSFFADFSKAILYGWNVVDSNKYSLGYKPPGVEDLISIALDAPESQKSLTPTLLSLTSVESKKALLLEELNGFQIDIDYLKPILEKKSQMSRQELPKYYSRTSLARVKQKRYSKYPSLTEHTLSTRDDSNSEGFKTQDNARPTITSLDLSQDSRRSLDRQESLLNSEPVIRTLTDVGTNRKSQQQSRIIIVSQKSKHFSSAKSIEDSQNKKIISSVKPSLNKRDVLAGKENSPKNEKTLAGHIKVLDFDSIKDPRSKLQDITKAAVQTTKEGIIKKSVRYSLNNPTPLTDDTRKNSSEVPHQKTPINPSQSVKFLDPIQKSTKTNRGASSGRSIKKVVHKEPEIDAFDHEKLNELGKLFPVVVGSKTDIDLEASKEDFSTKHLIESDHGSLALCEFLEELFKTALSKSFDDEAIEKRIEAGLGINVLSMEDIHYMKKKYELKRGIGVQNIDFGMFWQAIFGSNSALFENLLKNYLFKIKLHHLQESNSGYVSGVLVNLILEECIKENPDFDPYVDQIRSICRKHFAFLGKTLVQSYAWVQNTKLKIYLQDQEVKNPLGTGRILLAQTLKLFIENDEENGYKLTKEITDACWHVLVNWFFANQTNNTYHRIFYAIIETSLLNNTETYILSLLFKHSIVPNMYKVWSEIYQNNMIRRDKHIDSILYHLRKLAYLVEMIAKDNEEFKVLNRELKRSLSWEIVKNGLLSLKNMVFNNEPASRPGSRIKNKAIFSSSLAFKNQQEVLSESIPSKSDHNDTVGEKMIDSEASFDDLDNMNSALKEIEQELRK